MINIFSKAIEITSHYSNPYAALKFGFASTPNHTQRPKVSPPPSGPKSGPSIKTPFSTNSPAISSNPIIPGSMKLAKLAQEWNIPQIKLRNQLINPKGESISPDQIRSLRMINELKVAKVAEGVFKKKSPVVTIMGHVDHGKTTLIDYLRHSNIAEKEDGGITQKIGAFHVICQQEKITFIDTPGHQAFTNMRSRGASLTDLIVLIVSGTQGVKQQTKEVIQILKRDNIPTITAITKIDINSADPQSVEDSLFQAGLDIEPKGGKIPVVHISAKTGKNVDLLTELIIAETKDMTAIEEGFCEGAVLQAYQNPQGFNAMTLIVQKGILKIGSLLLIGTQYTKVKNMHDDRGNILKEARPGDAVQIIGIPSIPVAGDFIYEVADERLAKHIALKRKEKINTTAEQDMQKNKTNLGVGKIRTTWYERKGLYRGMSDLWVNKFNEKEQQYVEQIQSLKVKLQKGDESALELIIKKEEELRNHKEYVYQYFTNIKDQKDSMNIILKFADRGIEETLLQQIIPIIQKIKNTSSIEVRILGSEVGDVTKGDIETASVSNATIYTFGSKLSSEAETEARLQNIYPKVHKLIHTFLKDVEQSAYNYKKARVSGVECGRCDIHGVFKVKSKKKGVEDINVIGVKVTSGKLIQTGNFYHYKDNLPCSELLKATSLKIFKKDSIQVKKGQQCTITFETSINADGFLKGDQIVCCE